VAAMAASVIICAALACRLAINTDIGGHEIMK
jgi:hypothetical protein